MSANRDLASLVDIDYYARQVLLFVEGFTHDSLQEDAKTIAAVMYALAIVGEATKRLSPEFRALHSEIPWKQIAGMRDYLVHDYKNIDFDLLWSVVSIEIPQLLIQLEPLLPSEESIL